MGLPLFTTPSEPKAAAGETAEKHSSGARSSIRRQRHRSVAHHDFYPRRLTSTVRGHWTPDFFFEGTQEELDELRSGRAISSQADSFVDSTSHDARTSELDGERMRLRDATSFERANVPNTVNEMPPLLPAVPELRDRRTNHETLSRTARLHLSRNSHSRIPAVRQEIFTSSRQNVESSTNTLDGPRIDNHLPESNSDGLEHRPTMASLSGFELPGRTINSSLPFRAYTPINTNLLERIRALNRISAEVERSNRSSRQTFLDSLGDRSRSLSPESGAPWRTLPTYLNADSQPSGERITVDSASTAPNPSTAGAVSGDVAITSPEQMVEPLYANLFNYPERDTNSNIEDLLREYNRITPGRRNIFNIISVLEPILSRPETASVEELAAWHYLISRLTDREDIPDEWWASIGLNRSAR